MKKKGRKKRKLSKAQAKVFLATAQGQLWLEKKIAEKRANRPDPGPPPERFTRTKYPFPAMINGRLVVVCAPDDIR